MSRLGGGPEFDAIRAVLGRAQHSHPLLTVGPGDDCAVIGNLAISTDVSVENVHFRRDWLTPEEIGWRAAAASLSDLAAVGAEAIGILVSLVATDTALVEGIMRGATDALQPFDAALIGGDLSRGERLAIDVVAVGAVQQPLLRAHAQPGDELWVTGVLGGSAAAVHALERGETPTVAARTRFISPTPRIHEMLWLRRHITVRAAIDLSDGLFGDAAHIAAASSCGILIDAEAVPVDTVADASYQQAVSGGEDYEICFTAPADTVAQVKEAFEKEFGVRLTQVGQVTVGNGVHVRTDGRITPAHAGGYQHFGKGEDA